MKTEDVVKSSVEGSKVILECNKGIRIVSSKTRLDCLRRCLKSIHH